MAKEPANRYATAAEMSDDLRRFLASEPVRARPASPLDRLTRRARREPALAALLGLAAFSLVVTFLLIAALAARPGAGGRGHQDPGSGPSERSGPAGTPIAAPVPVPVPEPVLINIAYGTEKKKWLEGALADYVKTPAGQGVHINLIGMGSVEGADAVLDGPRPSAAPHLPIHVWSPASSAYRDVLEAEWRIKHGASPILAAENLALTPMVFVMWKPRHEAFVKAFEKVNFETLGRAMKEPEGWATIAGRPEWGLFKLGHTDPNKSNSGLQALVLMAYEFAGKQRGLTMQDITSSRFQDWLRSLERGITRHGSSLSHSTGTLMEEMVMRGPSQYDCLMVYENLAIDYLQAAIERWGSEAEFQVSYPSPNTWNEHPYYILDVPWSDDRQRKAAADFLRYLMSEPVQRRALEHGFRPGNPAVPINSPESPLVRNQRYGLRIDLPVMCEPPSAEVTMNLLGSFRRLQP